jgi:nucleoside-specific outer membrane channel protein Tsx
LRAFIFCCKDIFNHILSKNLEVPQEEESGAVESSRLITGGRAIGLGQDLSGTIFNYMQLNIFAPLDQTGTKEKIIDNDPDLLAKWNSPAKIFNSSIY